MIGTGKTPVVAGGNPTVAEMAGRDAKNFQAWKDSPSGQSAMGFGRVNCRGGAEALASLKGEQAARDARR